MKNFFASLLGALIGVFIALFVAFLIGVGVITVMVSSFKTKEVTRITTPSVLEIRLNHPIAERSAGKPFSFNFDKDEEKTFTETVGLNDIVADIQHAAKDSLIKGIYLNLSDIKAGLATLETIRAELEKFKSGGKFIIAYSLSYSQKAYYMASVADKVYLYPEGELFWLGLSSQVMFYKKALEKLGVQVQVFRHGRYKSYVEPYVLDKMSPDNKLQTRMLLSSIWDKLLEDIGSSRHLTPANLNMMADSLAIRSAMDANKRTMVDSLLFPDQVVGKLRIKMGLSSSALVPTISLDDYRETFKVHGSGSKIALIYATGDISQGVGDDDAIGSARLAKCISDARLDKDIKAIVLRVNSPGGDALASEVIWREVDLAKKSKPVIVSMGDYAASGGYEISCAATEIVAQATTITGSIGVFGLLPNAQALLNDKLGITIDTVSTNTHAAAQSVFYPLSSAEAIVLQGAIENIYHNFISRVADGRKLTIAQVDSIAQGRVWTGAQAIKLGLVDTLGDMNIALKIAARLAHLTKYSIEELPRPFGPFHKLLSRFSSDEETKLLKNELGDMYMPVNEITKLMHNSGVQARIPYEYNIE
jgi:protease-4